MNDLEQWLVTGRGFYFSICFLIDSEVQCLRVELEAKKRT